MARIRTIKPEFFRHELLQDLETKHPGQHVMLTFAGLWTQADANGEFRYRPRTLHLDILPFLEFDFERTLQILTENNFVKKIETEEGNISGIICNFDKHQRITGTEYSSVKGYCEKQKGNTEETQRKQQGNNQVFQEKEKEMEREREMEQGKRKGSAVAHAREGDPVENLGEFISSRLDDIARTTGMDVSTIGTIAAKWVDNKLKSNDWRRYRPEQLISFIVTDILSQANAERLNYRKK